ncbi:MAG: Hsp33 family molecular chaperone HslO [Panacagrimonas sp.]
MDQSLTGFAFDNHVAHGAIVHFRAGEILRHRHYSADVAHLLSEAMAVMPLLATHLGFGARISLQFQGEGRLKMLVAQVDQALNVRAMAKADAEAQGGLAQLMGQGILALTVSREDASRPDTQAMIPLQAETLSGALQDYFDQSEQLPTLIRVATQGDALAAFMLQRLPLEHAQGGQDDWEHLRTLSSTLGGQELLQTDAQTLLRRLFADAPPLRLFDARPVQSQCRCDRQVTSALLRSMGQQEVSDIVAEQGQVELTCEFCGAVQRFSPEHVAQLFGAPDGQKPATRH